MIAHARAECIMIEAGEGGKVNGRRRGLMDVQGGDSDNPARVIGYPGPAQEADPITVTET